jgi:predicted nucleic acid-binding protein
MITNETRTSPSSKRRPATCAIRRTTIELIQVQDLLHRMWELRGHVSGYDAADLAAAEHFCYPLVTSDARLARFADGLECDVRLVWPDPE